MGFFWRRGGGIAVDRPGVLLLEDFMSARARCIIILFLRLFMFGCDVRHENARNRDAAALASSSRIYECTFILYVLLKLELLHSLHTLCVYERTV